MDIVERLRTWGTKGSLLAEAADEISRLLAMLPDAAKRQRECKTIDDWRALALSYESQWGGCSYALNKQAEEIARLRSVCGEAYQMAGALGASVEALDNLSAAASGDPLPHETFLPVTESDEIARLRDELDRECMRLAACGVVALANTPDSANEARHMHESYKSASCDDVARMVDEQMRLRDENAKLRNELDERLLQIWSVSRLLTPGSSGAAFVEQVEQMAKDAERYRWLRDDADAADWEMLGYQDADKTDAAVDAAMQKRE